MPTASKKPSTPSTSKRKKSQPDLSCRDSFRTLSDAVDGTASGELHDVPREAYWQVVEHCYLCDMCYMTKCPYVPPHEWNVDFPHLMLRAKVKRFEDGNASARDKILSATDAVGSLAGIPVVAEAVNAFN